MDNDEKNKIETLESQSNHPKINGEIDRSSNKGNQDEDHKHGHDEGDQEHKQDEEDEEHRQDEEETVYSMDEKCLEEVHVDYREQLKNTRDEEDLEYGQDEEDPDKSHRSSKKSSRSLSVINFITIDSAKQFKNVGVVIILTTLMSFNYVVPNIALITTYSGPAENDRYVKIILTCMIAPIFVTTLINLAWYIDDDFLAKDQGRKVASKKMWYIRSFFLLIQMGTVLRFAHSFYYGYKSKHSEGKKQADYIKKMMQMEKDATLLRSFTAFMQSVPQFALQLYILTEGPEHILRKGTLWQTLSIVGSLGSMTWATVSCDRIIGAIYKEEIVSNWRVIIVMLLPWRLFTIASRMTVLALFSSLFPTYFGLGCIAHYAIMYLFIQHQKVASKHGTRSEVFLYLVGGFVYIITDLMVKYERSYHKHIVYHTTVFIENSLMLAVWFVYSDISTPEVRGATILGVNVSFVIGLFFRRLFWEFHHPNVKSCFLCKCCQENLALPKKEEGEEEEEVNNMKWSNFGKNYT